MCPITSSACDEALCSGWTGEGGEGRRGEMGRAQDRRAQQHVREHAQQHVPQCAHPLLERAARLRGTRLEKGLVNNSEREIHVHIHRQMKCSRAHTYGAERRPLGCSSACSPAQHPAPLTMRLRARACVSVHACSHPSAAVDLPRLLSLRRELPGR